MKWCAIVLAGVLVGEATAAAGQQSVETVSIIRAVLSADREYIPGAQVALDPQLVRLGPRPEAVGWARPLSAEERSALTGGPRTVRVATFDDLKRCAGVGPRACRLMGVDSHVRFSDPVIAGDSAWVETSVGVNTTEGPSSINYLGVAYVLVREGGGWRVALRRLTSIS